jgi:hypothetical protein
MSFFPKLLIEPVSRAIDPQFASTLVWQGMSLEMIYGYWNPVPVMLFAVAAAAILYDCSGCCEQPVGRSLGVARSSLSTISASRFPRG